MIQPQYFRHSERGGAGVKVLLVFAVLFLIGNAGYHLIPVMYEGANLKQDLNAAVIQAYSSPDRTQSPAQILKTRLDRITMANNAPPNVFKEVKQTNDSISARVYYVKIVPVIPFNIYNYTYVFDETATPSGYLMK